MQRRDGILVQLTMIQTRRQGKPVDGGDPLGVNWSRLTGNQVDAWNQHAERGRARSTVR